MNDDHRDASLLIGLHKLAEQNGDGLVPELYALMSARAETAADMRNVVQLPVPSRSKAADVRPAGAFGKVLAFRR